MKTIFNIVLAAIVVVIINFAVVPTHAARFGGSIDVPVSFDLGVVKPSLDVVENTLTTLEKKAAQLLSVSNFGSESCKIDATRADTCAVPACGDTFTPERGFKCSQDYGNASLFCDAAGGGSDCADGLVRSLTSTTVSFPPGTDFESSAVESFICKSREMVPLFSEHAKLSQVGWQYVADANGALRVFPGAPQPRGSGHCNRFDVRQRPWYVSALSGPKDVVIVYDRSGSMGSVDQGAQGQSRMDLVKKAIVQLLTTFTTDDFIGLVGFSSNAYPHAGKLRRARASYVRKMQEEMYTMGAGGGTYMSRGFGKAFDILVDSKNPSGINANSPNSTSSECTKIVIFLTDGMASDSVEDIMNAINNGQERLVQSGSKRAHMFTYSMGPGADDEIPRRVACENKGIWARILGGVNPLDQMAQYYRFLASTSTTSDLRWSAPYEDSLGSGLMITVAKPVVDRTGAEPRIMGVVATDVLLSQLGVKTDEDIRILEDELMSRGSCPTRSISECNYQMLRAETGYTCPKEINPSECLEEIGYPIAIAKKLEGGRTINDVLCSPIDPDTRASPNTRLTTQDVTCCGTHPTPLLKQPQGAGAPPPAPTTAPPGNTSGPTTPPNDAPLCELPTYDSFFPPLLDSHCPAVDECAATFCSCAGSLPDPAFDRVKCMAHTTDTTFGTCADMSMCVKTYVSCVEDAIVDKNDVLKPLEPCTLWAKQMHLDLLMSEVPSDTHSKSACQYHTCRLVSSLGDPARACNLTNCATTCAGMTSEEQTVPTPAPVPNPGTVLHTSGGLSSAAKPTRFVVCVACLFLFLVSVL